MMEIQDISAEELRTKNKYICENSTAKQFANYNFWHYSALRNIDLILRNQYFLVNNLNNMNDKNELALHSEDCNNIHILSFCNSNTEKIPMWYLYSGISGDGAAIGLTPKTMLDFISSIDVIEVESNGRKLYKDNDFTIDYGWVFYRKGTTQINYKNKWYSLQNPDEFKKGNAFIKDYPWEYEKEFRIVIKTREQCGKLKIHIKDLLLQKIKIKLAPELKEIRFKNLIPELYGFHNLLSKQTLYSNLGIEMDLVKNNIGSLLDYLNSCDIRKLSEQAQEKLNQFISKYIKYREETTK